MNREIKFRAYIKEDYNKELVGKILNVSSLHLNTKKAIIGYSTSGSNYGNKSFDFNDIELMQFTGLYDKNKVPIYEGDILGYRDCEDKMQVDGVVKYGEFNCSCCNGVYGWYVDGGDIRANYLHEVIGNIYENSDLLGE